MKNPHFSLPAHVTDVEADERLGHLRSGFPDASNRDNFFAASRLKVPLQWVASNLCSAIDCRNSAGKKLLFYPCFRGRKRKSVPRQQWRPATSRCFCASCVPRELVSRETFSLLLGIPHSRVLRVEYLSASGIASRAASANSSRL
ncbi:unnamed protein product [Ixodes persulcatus]